MNRTRIARAVRVLSAGGVIAYPTEAVYGLGCDPLDPRAFGAILRIKRRRADKGVIVIAADPDQLEALVASGDTLARERLRAPVARPTTWIVPAARGVPDWLTGGRDTIAVRITAHPVAAALCLAFRRPIVSTSANRAGRPAARTALQVRCRLGPDVDAIVAGAVGGASRPSEIRDARTGAVLREGDGTR